MQGAACSLHKVLDGLASLGAGATPQSPVLPATFTYAQTEAATTPLVSGHSDLAKPSLYLRLSPACPVLALAAGSCYLPTLREQEAQKTLGMP